MTYLTKISKNFNTFDNMKGKKKNVKLSVEINKYKTKQAYEIQQFESTYFPYPPYPEQKQILKGISIAIHKQTHAIIQSPTGTGKTLCLLIGALSSLVRDGKDGKSKIYYLTRTHSQITQVISQIDKTVYDFKVNIIGSRENLCINHNFSQLKGKQLDKACSEACSQKLCKYRDFTETQIPKIMNASQYRQYGLKKSICPYYFSRQSTEKCEFTIMPFNYLLDWNLLQCNHLNLKDSIIIFDEAHNIDRLAEQGASIELTTDLIYYAVMQLTNLYKNSRMKILHTKLIDQQDTIETCDIKNFKNMFNNLHKALKSEKIQQFFKKGDILEFIEKSTEYIDASTQIPVQGIDLTLWCAIMGKAKKIIKLFFKKQILCQNYQQLINVFQKMFDIIQNQWDNYCVSITEDNKTRLIDFKCLNPCVAFKKIMKQKPRSLILSSGTLCSFEFWQKYLNIHFETKLVINSYVTPEKMFARILGESKNHWQFDFSFAKKHHDEQYIQLVEQLKMIQKAVNKGIVVAFSTYELMERTLQRALTLKKKIYYETKNCNIDDLYSCFSKSALTQGAFLFMVMKGRFSEGINFNDDLCRCMVIVGIPFLPLNSKHVLEKKKFISQKQSKQHAQKWYKNQGFISLNQTIGRVIRNKNDYGIVILADHRFNRNDIKNQLPLWFRNCIRTNSHIDIYLQIQAFLRNQSWLNEDLLTNNNNQEKIILRQCRSEVTTKKDIKINKKTNIKKLVQFSTPAKSKKQLLLDPQEESLEEIKLQKQKKKKNLLIFEPQKIKLTDISYFIKDQLNNFESSSQQNDQKGVKIQIISKHQKNKKINFDQFNINF